MEKKACYLFLIFFHLALANESIKFRGLTIYLDQKQHSHRGFDNCNMTTNGELMLVKNIINNDNIIFDAGANVGEWSKSVLNNFQIKLYAFEPDPITYHILEKNLKKYKKNIFSLGLGNENEQKELIIYEKCRACNSIFYRPILANKMNTKAITVKLVTLDSFCEKRSISLIDFLKIDTEGSELNILLGAKKLLKNNAIKIIQFEYGGTYSDANITLKTVCEFLSLFHYKIFRVVPDGLVYINNWQPNLENYKYSNYVAISKQKLKQINVKINE